MIWLLLEMFLAFGRVHAFPAEPSPALCALNLRATTARERNPNPTLGIRASLSAMLDVNLIHSTLDHLVLVSDLFHLRGILLE